MTFAAILVGMTLFINYDLGHITFQSPISFKSPIVKTSDYKIKLDPIEIKMLPPLVGEGELTQEYYNNLPAIEASDAE